MGAICAVDVDVRRRRLDALFEDEPYLSATMMASRLHERELLKDGKPAVREIVHTVAPPRPPALPEASVAKLGFVVNVRQEPQGLRAELKPDDSPDVMTVAEAARFLRVGEGTVRRWARSEGLPCARIGRSRRFRKSALVRWLKLRERSR